MDNLQIGKIVHKTIFCGLTKALSTGRSSDESDQFQFNTLVTGDIRFIGGSSGKIDPRNRQTLSRRRRLYEVLRQVQTTNWTGMDSCLSADFFVLRLCVSSSLFLD